MAKTLQELFGLKGKAALVTGASSGLGVEFAKALAIAGADVAVLARRRGKLQEVALQVEAQGVHCHVVAADLTDWTQVERAVTDVEQALGKIDILVNNAGIAPLVRAEKMPRDQWDSAIAVNLTAPFLLTQRVARGMIERGEGGRIINIASAVSAVANAIYPTVSYVASKAGLANLTRQLAVEWARYSITVNAIAPGWFPTEMSIDPRYGDVHPKYKEKMEQLTPLGRVGREGELMGAIIYLASPAASFVTGAVLAVDGGWTIW
jgi:gluconate 5-dehydrogenase